jgi:hypothetical protein
MTGIGRGILRLGLICVLFAGSALGQQTTGVITGRVNDGSGAVIPGVTVSLTSPVIQGERSALSDEAGNYRFLLLPPGVYAVAFELSGFQKLIREGIIVEVTKTTTVNVALNVASVADTVTVTGESPVVDVQNVNVATSFNQQLLESLPTARDLWAVLRETPGLQMTGFDVGGSTMGTQTGFRSYGRSGQNWVTLDGVATTEGTGTAGVYYDYGSFSEISVSAAGNSAEVAIPGSSINTVMKSGGNDIRGEVYFDWEDDSFQGDNLTDELTARGVTVGDKFTRYNDFNVNAGGPYVKDKFWWFFAYHDQFSGLQTQLRFNDGTPGAVFTTRLKNYSAKANYQINDKNQLIFSTQASSKLQPYRGGQGNGAGNFILESTQGQKGGPYKTWKFQLTSVLNNNATLDASTNMLDSPSLRYTHVDKTPTTNTTTGAVRGGYNDPNNTFRMIWQNYVNLAYFKGNLIHGTHGFKLGYGYIQGGEYENHTGAPAEAGLIGHAQLTYVNNSAGVQVPDSFSVTDTPVEWKYNYSQHYFFVQDKWQISKNFTFNLGLRFDRYAGYYPQQGNPGTGPYAEKTVFAARDVTGFHNFVPRFSIAWDVFGNTKTALKASWGKFSENVGTGFVMNVNPVSMKTFRYRWDGSLPITPDVVSRSTLLGVTGTTTLPEIDPNLKNALTQQYTAGIEQEIYPGFGVAANFVRTFGYNKYGTIDRAYSTSEYLPVTAIDPGADGVADLANDRRITIYERTVVVGRSQNLFFTNFGGGDHYSAYDVRATKRMSKNWQMIASYQWDKVNQAPPNSTDPNTLVWGANTNPGRGHYTTNSFKLLGTYELPKGFGFSGTYESQKGGQYSRTALFTGAAGNILNANGTVRTNNLTQGSLTLTMDAPGTYFTPRVNLLNLRVDKTFKITENQSLTGMFDLFNVFNANTVLQTENLSTTVRDANNVLVPRFGRVTTITNPIIFRIGARYKF